MSSHARVKECMITSIVSTKIWLDCCRFCSISAFQEHRVTYCFSVAQQPAGRCDICGKFFCMCAKITTVLSEESIKAGVGRCHGY